MAGTTFDVSSILFFSHFFNSVLVTIFRTLPFSAMKAIMSTVYGITLLAFVALFVYFILLLRRSFVDMYSRMKVKMFLFFAVSMLVMTFRYFVYNLIQFTEVTWLSVETLQGEIPLYISEILIALCYMMIMVTGYRQQKLKEPQSND